MKTSALAFSLSLLTLAGCGGALERADLFENPLYQKYYYQDLANHMAEYSIQNDPMLKDAEKKGVVDNARTRALEHIAHADSLINAGRKGAFMSDTDYAAGTALLAGRTLHFSQDFNVYPGPSLRVYVSSMLDPRGESGSTVLFPNDASADLGPLQTPYMAQSYALPDGTDADSIRSVAIWDARLQRLFGFAQIQ